MPDPDRGSEEFTNDQLEVLAQQQADLDEALEKQEISQPEHTRQSAKIAFQMAQINDRNAQSEEQQQQRDSERRFERGNDLFHD